MPGSVIVGTTLSNTFDVVIDKPSLSVAAATLLIIVILFTPPNDLFEL